MSVPDTMRLAELDQPTETNCRKLGRTSRVQGLRRFRGRWVAAVVSLVLLGAPAITRAAEDTTDRDGRLEGYDKAVVLESNSTGTTWMLFFFLSVVGCSVLFKNANRSHLD